MPQVVAHSQQRHRLYARISSSNELHVLAHCADGIQSRQDIVEGQMTLEQARLDCKLQK